MAKKTPKQKKEKNPLEGWSFEFYWGDQKVEKLNEEQKAIVSQRVGAALTEYYRTRPEEFEAL